MPVDTGFSESGTVPSSVIETRQYVLPQYGVPDVPNAPTEQQMSMQAIIEARSGYTLDDPERQRIEQRGGYGLYTPPQDPLEAQYMDMFGVPYNPYTGPGDPFDEREDALTIAQQQYLAEEIITQTRGAESRFVGDEFYQGGSEQAALGVYHQQLANLGMLSDEELGFLGLTPTDQMSWILSPADVRRLTSEDSALSTYANDLRNLYGDDWFEQLYETDEETGWATLITYGDVDDDIGGWDGYGGGGYGGGGYGGTYQAAARNGLINWRIG